MLDLYYSNNKTNTIIIAFDSIGDYPYIVKMNVGVTTIEENNFKTQKEALCKFMWLVSGNIINEENI